MPTATGAPAATPAPPATAPRSAMQNGMVVAELSEFLGFRTNNYAEYAGLLACLQYALDHGSPSLRVVSDSKLMVMQIQGRYKINSPDLKPLWTEARARIAKLPRFEIAHALRHKNKAADRLANEAMDRGTKRPHPPGTPAPALLAATPYPTRNTAPPVPTRLDPATAPRHEVPIVHAERPTPKPVSSRPESARSRDAVEKPALSLPKGSPHSVPAQAEPPAMLRGFTRDGVIHILGPHTLPDGRFVKIIPE